MSAQNTNEKVQNAATGAQETATEYAKTAYDNVSTAAVNTKEYVSEQLGVAPKEKTTGEKVEEAATSVKDRAQEGAQSVNEKVSTYADIAAKNINHAAEDTKEYVADKADEADEGITNLTGDAKKTAKKARNEVKSDATAAKKYASDTATRVEESAKNAKKDASDKMDTAADRARAAQADLSGENDGFLKGYPRHTDLEKRVVALASTGVGLVFRVGRYALTKVGLQGATVRGITSIRTSSYNAFENVDSLRGVKRAAEQYWPVRLMERMVGEVDANVQDQLSM